MMNVVHERVIGLEIKIFSMFKNTKLFHMFSIFHVFYFFLRREHDRKGLSPNTAPAMFGEIFLCSCSWLLSFQWARLVCDSGLLSKVAHTENLMDWDAWWVFQTQQPCVGPTSCSFLTGTAAVLLQATVQGRFLAYVSSILIFIHAQSKLLLKVIPCNSNCSSPSRLWQAVALAPSPLCVPFE